MKTLLRAILPALFVMGFLCSTREAHALGPVGIEVGAQVGGAPNPNTNLPNALGFGAGGRAGVTLFGGLYGGVKIMDYIGSAKDLAGETSVSSAGISLKAHSLQEGVDVGWGFKILLLTIRPQIGLGNINTKLSYDGSASTTAGSGSGISFSGTSYSHSSFYLEPGVTGLISLGLLYIGADINYLYIPSYPNNDLSGTKGASSVTIHGQIGIQF